MTVFACTRRPCAIVVLVGGLVAALLSPAPAAAVTGNEWRAMPAAARTAYVAGVLDNLLDFGSAIRSLVPAEKRSASEKMLVGFEDCMARTPRPTSQLVAIVDKYVKDNPAQWHTRMSGLVFEALRCRAAATPSPARKPE
ncbi:MAG TPA: Rap1a/Tai family immunity protein [Candidatus Bathyarchaeia archaeon]|nr:Rap1a/Tai family immunity protein [Candidatus Bathyarchaeia archaeon]